MKLTKKKSAAIAAIVVAAFYGLSSQGIIAPEVASTVENLIKDIASNLTVMQASS